MDLLARIHRAAKELEVDSRIVELGESVLNDMHPVLEHAYIFSETEDNERSVFHGAKQMQGEGVARTFLVMDGAEANGFPGYDNWNSRLGRIIGKGNIIAVAIEDPYQVNTLSESVSLVAQARRDNITGIHIVAAPFHQLRALMTLASEAIKKEQSDFRLDIFSYMGEDMPWNETVAHSQGKLVATRAELVWHEMDRIKRYSAKGDILPVKEIIEYMDCRTLPAEA